MKQASKELDIPVDWGGDWESFKDGAHFQLSYSQYP
jgi:peptidoglycan L-alanyl-D-glutamate endopeptidase CwlK